MVDRSYGGVSETATLEDYVFLKIMSRFLEEFFPACVPMNGQLGKWYQQFEFI